jgi:hypothetical protein
MLLRSPPLTCLASLFLLFCLGFFVLHPPLPHSDICFVAASADKMVVS